MVQNTAPILGIDLGTTYSSIGIYTPAGIAVLDDDQGQTAIPSIVWYQPGHAPVVGHNARPSLLTDPQNTVYSFKRLLGKKWDSPAIRVACSGFPYHVVQGPTGQPLVAAGGKRMPLVAVAADLLIHLKNVAEGRLQQPVSQVVVTVPASADELQRQVTEAACRLAHLQPVRVINEPTAAAMAFGYAHFTNGTIAVYDFGGGTFDFTILEIKNNVFRVLANAGDNFLGGDDIDTALAKFLSNHFWQMTKVDLTTSATEWQRLLWAAEKCKRELSFQPTSHIFLENVALRSTGPVHMDGWVTREMLEAVSREPVERSLQTVQEALDAAGLRAEQLDSVVLVGGTTLMPLVRQAVARFFCKEPDTRLDPMIAVVCGAAWQAAMLAPAVPARAPSPSPRPSLPPAGSPPRSNLAATLRPYETTAERTPAAPSSPPVDLAAAIAESMSDAAPGAPLHSHVATLLDVSPHTVGVGTEGMRYQAVVRKNTPIPAEGKIRLRTWKDNQTEMVINVFQGESPNPDANSRIGEMRVTGLAPRPRGMIMVDVTTEVDSNGRVKMTVRQAESGKVMVTRLHLDLDEGVSLS